MQTYNVYTHYDDNKRVIGRIKPNENHEISERTYQRLLKNRAVGGHAGIYTDAPFDKCNCGSAVLARIRAKHIKDATTELNDVFAYRFYNDEEIEGSNEMYADIKEHIEQLIPFTVDLDLLKADFYVNGLGKITLSVNSDSVIKIKRTVSNSIERRA